MTYDPLISKVVELFRYLLEQLLDGIDVKMSQVEIELQDLGQRGLNNSLLIVNGSLLITSLLALSQFLSDERERAATQYLNITTIATFLSSITATMLQMSITFPTSSLAGTVNFFWFLSLVFSISSGMSSLLGLTWRKSSM